MGEGKSIHCYVVEWDPLVLSWKSFRNDLLGYVINRRLQDALMVRIRVLIFLLSGIHRRPTDPSDAPKGSIRRHILDRYKSLGLKLRPNKGDNGVHASASPFEGLVEKANWLGTEFRQDSFGKALLDGGLTEGRIEAWAKDARIKLTETEEGSIFDALEDMDADECLERILALNKLN